MSKTKYIFVDKTEKCFESFQDLDDGSGYNDRKGDMLRAGVTFEVGDMMVIRDELIEAGFEWGKDFYVKKVINTEKEERP